MHLEQGATVLLVFPVLEAEEVPSKADRTTHGSAEQANQPASSAEAFLDFTSPTSETDGPFLCVLAAYYSVSGPLTLHITCLFTCLLLPLPTAWALSYSFRIPSTQHSV